MTMTMDEDESNTANGQLNNATATAAAAAAAAATLPPSQPICTDVPNTGNGNIINTTSSTASSMASINSSNNSNSNTNIVVPYVGDAQLVPIGTPIVNELRLAFSQMKGALEDDITDGGLESDIISCVEFSSDGELLATGDKGGRVVIFQRDNENDHKGNRSVAYNFYSTFQSHEAEFDYLKSLEIEEKINKIRWLKKKNASNFLLSTNDKTIKLWKISERDKQFDGFNLKDDNGKLRLVDPNSITSLRVPRVVPSKKVVQQSARRIFANAHTYLINSISVNSDQETYLSADDLRINLWNIEINDESFNIVDIKPANMEELTEVITASEFHPQHCNLFVYSSSKGILRLCDMREAALCDRHAKIFEESEDTSFFSEIISSISGIKFSNDGRYLISRDYMSIKVWDINMERKPVETYQVHEYLRSKLCSLFESDYIFDKFECSIDGSDTHIMTGSYNNFFKIFDRRTKREMMYEANKDVCIPMMPGSLMKQRKVYCNTSAMANKSVTDKNRGSITGISGVGNNNKKDDINVDSLDFTSKILHTAWHPKDNIIAVAATNHLFLFKEQLYDEND